MSLDSLPFKVCVCVAEQVRTQGYHIRGELRMAIISYAKYSHSQVAKVSERLLTWLEMDFSGFLHPSQALAVQPVLHHPLGTRRGREGRGGGGSTRNYAE